MKKIAIFVLFNFAFLAALEAQTENSAFTLTGSGVATPFATDYQSVGINPANLGWTYSTTESNFALGFAESGYSIYSEVLSKEVLRNNVFGGGFEDLSRSEKEDLAQEFINSPLALDVDVMSFGFSYASEGFGGIALTVSDRIDYYSEVGPLASELLFLGYTATYFDSLLLSNGNVIANNPNLNPEIYDLVVEGFTSEEQALPLSKLLDGTRLEGEWTREINLSYGRKILETEAISLYGGVGVKYVMGMFLMDVVFSGGAGTGVAAYAPFFDLDAETISGENPSSLPQSSSFFKPAGEGYGFDLGASIIIKEKLTLSAAVNDIGSITWNGNVFSVNDLELTSLSNPGVSNLSFMDQLETFAGEDGIISWEGEQQVTRNLPTTVRAGAGLKLNEMLNVGVDAVIPANDSPGNYQNAVLAVGGRFSPIPWIELSTGFITGGNYDFKIPAGVVFKAGGSTYEAGIASRDLITFFSDNQPTVSLTTGFLRFRF